MTGAAEPATRGRVDPDASGVHTVWSRRGLAARSLLPLAALFGAVTALRRALYRFGWLRTHRVGRPVVVVGNLVAGGAGKTPTVLAVVELLRRRGYTPGIVSRGHGARRRGAALVSVDRGIAAHVCGDEPLLLHLRSGAPVVVGRDRVGAARELLRRHPVVDVIVSDDGLQHLALDRVAQLIVFDERGAGNGWLLPAGPLREPLPARVPPASLVLYNATAPSTPLPGSIARRGLVGAVELAAWRRGEPATRATLHDLRGRPLHAVAGVARPGRFFAMLREAGLGLEPQVLPDHHAYATLPWPPDTADVIVTEKDAVKLDPAAMGATRVWVAPLDFGFEPAFEAALLRLLPPPGP